MAFSSQPLVVPAVQDPVSVLGTYLRPQAPRAVLLAVCLFAGIGLQLLGPQVLARFIDGVTHGASLERLWTLAGVFIAAATAGQAARLGGLWFSEQVGWAATNRLRADLAAHCLSLDMGFHTARTPGEMIERIDGDVGQLAGFFSDFVFQILGAAVLLAGVLVLLFAVDLRVGAAMSLFVAGAFAFLRATRQFAVASYRDERQARSGMAGFIEERLGGLDDIRANGGGGHVMGVLQRLNTELTARGREAARRAVLHFSAIETIFVTGFAAALALGAYLYQQRAISLGSVYLVVQYTGMLRNPLSLLQVQLQGLQRARASLERVVELRATAPALREGPGLKLGKGPPGLAFEAVSFAYADGAPVLEDVSFQLPAGKVLGLLGRTGGGKTTLTRLICRLYDPAAGAVRLDGRDLRDARHADLRARIGVVTQDVQIFHASVRDNLTIFDPAVPDGRLMETLDDLGLAPWLGRLPQGLDTVLAGSGGLSAGEAQLLAFARVFLRDPGLVLLDEASSRLDPGTERRIEHALDRLLGARRTVVIVAHRLATVHRADQILILDRGRVAEAGGREALAADPASRFAGLLRTGLEEVMA